MILVELGQLHQTYSLWKKFFSGYKCQLELNLLVSGFVDDLALEAMAPRQIRWNSLSILRSSPLMHEWETKVSLNDCGNHAFMLTMKWENRGPELTVYGFSVTLMRIM